MTLPADITQYLESSGYLFQDITATESIICAAT